MSRYRGTPEAMDPEGAGAAAAARARREPQGGGGSGPQHPPGTRPPLGPLGSVGPSGSLGPPGPLGSLNAHHRRSLGLIPQKGSAFFQASIPRSQRTAHFPQPPILLLLVKMNCVVIFVDVKLKRNWFSRINFPQPPPHSGLRPAARNGPRVGYVILRTPPLALPYCLPDYRLDGLLLKTGVARCVDFIRGNLFFLSLTSTKITTQFILTSNIKTFV